jgi:hypothetical protein
MAWVTGVFEGKTIRMESPCGIHTLTVIRINGVDDIQVRTGDGREFRVTDRESVEVAPSVFVSAGVPVNMGSRKEVSIRLAFEAPKTVRLG